MPSGSAPIHRPETTEVPTGTLRMILAHCRRGLAPTVAWSEDRHRMDRQAFDLRGEQLAAIEAEIQLLLDNQ
ncbi:hypothetical protein OKA04_23315 [Luteolibacter flavescens]|uniref:Transposase n=1 Tax=Luteolibacter flavescens TaxID=1859460 RepID=A0ABT3FVS1_9BACT|nr:hypothetical protein [Luteolibacter flavescens]MCW1887686.1 hypothetical protein [Luteolibacter flavescens]